MPTNHEQWFGTPEKAALMYVTKMRGTYSGNTYIKLERKIGARTYQDMKTFTNQEEYLEWLTSEYDDGTIKWDEEND